MISLIIQQRLPRLLRQAIHPAALIALKLCLKRPSWQMGDGADCPGQRIMRGEIVCVFDRSERGGDSMIPEASGTKIQDEKSGEGYNSTILVDLYRNTMYNGV